MSEKSERESQKQKTFELPFVPRDVAKQLNKVSAYPYTIPKGVQDLIQGNRRLNKSLDKEGSQLLLQDFTKEVIRGWSEQRAKFKEDKNDPSDSLINSLLKETAVSIGVQDAAQDVNKNEHAKLSYWRLMTYYVYYLCSRPLQDRMIALMVDVEPSALADHDGVKELWTKITAQIDRECCSRKSPKDENAKLQALRRLDGQSCEQWLMRLMKQFRTLEELGVSFGDEPPEDMAAIQDPCSPRLEYAWEYLLAKEKEQLRFASAFSLEEALQLAQKVGLEAVLSDSITGVYRQVKSDLPPTGLVDDAKSQPRRRDRDRRKDKRHGTPAETSSTQAASASPPEEKKDASSMKCEHCKESGHTQAKCWKANACPKCGEKGHRPYSCVKKPHRSDALSTVPHDGDQLEVHSLNADVADRTAYATVDVGGSVECAGMDTQSTIDFLAKEALGSATAGREGGVKLAQPNAVGKTAIKSMGGVIHVSVYLVDITASDAKGVNSTHRTKMALVPRALLPQSLNAPATNVLLGKPTITAMKLSVDRHLYNEKLEDPGLLPVQRLGAAAVGDGQECHALHSVNWCMATVAVPGSQQVCADPRRALDIRTAECPKQYLVADSSLEDDAANLFSPFGQEKGEAPVGQWSSRSWSSGLIAASRAYDPQLVESYEAAKLQELKAEEECHVSESILRAIQAKRAAFRERVGKEIETNDEDGTESEMIKGISHLLPDGQFAEAMELVAELMSMRSRAAIPAKSMLTFNKKPGRVMPDVWPPVKLEFKEQSAFSGKGYGAKCPRPKWGVETAQMLSDWARGQVALGIAHIVSHEEVMFASRALIHCPNPDAEYPKLRVCIDVRAINAMLVKHISYNPSPDDIRDTAKGKNYYCTMDETGAFNQVPMDLETAMKFGVWTPLGILIHDVMFFGGEPFPSIMQAINTKILSAHPKWGIDVHCYMDDIIISSDDWRDHLRVVKEVCQLLADAGMTLSPPKFRLGHACANILGHKVSKEGSILSDEHVKAILDIDFPETEEDCRTVLGLMQYYHKQTAEYAELARTVRSMDVPRAERVAAFERLRHSLITAPILVPFDPEKEIGADVDANNRRIAGVLFHRIDGKECPILFFSYAWNATQQRWVIYVRELYGLVFCIDKCRAYFNASKHVPVIRTDHRPLLWIKHASSPMVVRWCLEYIQDCNFIVEYRPGSQHVNADCLTRVPMKTVGTATAEGILLCLEALFDTNVLPRLGGKGRYLLHIDGEENAPRVHRIMVEAKMTRRPPLVAKPSARTTADPDWEAAIIVPAAEEFPKRALIMFQQERPFAVLGPQDLAHLIEQDILDHHGGDTTVLQRWKTKSTIVFLNDCLCWFIVGMDAIPDRVYAIQTSVDTREEGEKGSEYDECCFAVEEAEWTVPSALESMPFTRKQLLRAQLDMPDGDVESLRREVPQMVKDESGLLVYRSVEASLSVGQDRPFVPRPLRTKLIQYIHRINRHAGKHGTMQAVARLVFWPSLLKDTEAFILDQRCIFCVVANAKRTLAQITFEGLKTAKRNEFFLLDCYGPISPPDNQGNQYIWTGFEPFTTMESGRATVNQDSASAMDFLLLDITYVKGYFRTLVTDASRILVGQNLTKMCKDMGISQWISAAWSPWMLGLLERRHADLKKWLLSLSSEDYGNFGKLLPIYFFQKNNTPRHEPQVCAHEIEYGSVLPTPLNWELMEPGTRLARVVMEEEGPPAPEEFSRRAAQAKRAVQAFAPVALEMQTRRQEHLDLQNAGKQPPKFAAGDKVLIYRRNYKKGQSLKLRYQWTGLFTVLDQVGHNLYSLENMQTKARTTASTPNMQRFKGDAKECMAFFAYLKTMDRAAARSVRLEAMEETEETIVESLDVGTMVAVRDVDAAPGSARYLVGEVLRVEPDRNAMLLHYWGCPQEKARQVEPVFRRAWIQRKVDTVTKERMTVFTKDDVPPIARNYRMHHTDGFDPWTGMESVQDLIVSGIIVLKTGKLDKDSRELLAGYVPTRYGQQ